MDHQSLDLQQHAAGLPAGRSGKTLGFFSGADRGKPRGREKTRSGAAQTFFERPGAPLNIKSAVGLESLISKDRSDAAAEVKLRIWGCSWSQGPRHHVLNKSRWTSTFFSKVGLTNPSDPLLEVQASRIQDSWP